MSLIEIWKENPDQLREKRVEQIIGFAGDGRLRDKGDAPAEFRAFLSRVPVEFLVRYADECLNKGFNDSGLALQDIVNQVAHRLGFSVEPGRYRGSKGENGFDGVWTGPDGHAIVAEVKTTDAYRLTLETVAQYRRDLIQRGDFTEEDSSILIVVGREETGEIEAQIRGSRYAWDVRLISIDALFRLLHIRQEVDEPNTEARIRSLLIPREYTRIDEIIDVVFSATEELLEEEAPSSGEVVGSEEKPRRRHARPVSFNEACAAQVGKHLSADLARESRITFADEDKGLVVTCAVSKEYEDPKGNGYWFALHPHQIERLKAATRGYAAYGCGSESQIALLPLAFLEPLLDGMNQTKTEKSSYWHIQITRNGKRWLLHRTKEFEWPDITDKMIFDEVKDAPERGEYAPIDT